MSYYINFTFEYIDRSYTITIFLEHWNSFLMKSWFFYHMHYVIPANKSCAEWPKSDHTRKGNLFSLIYNEISTFFRIKSSILSGVIYLN